MSTRTVCILLAGRGARMGAYSDWIHKSLLPLGGRAILSRIITAFPSDFRFVFAVHHLQQQIRDFVSLAHPEIDAHFVAVDSISGPTSGPGYSLAQCASQLQHPFYLVCGDTLFDENLNGAEDEDWIAVPIDPVGADERFCNLKVENGRVVEIRDKTAADGDGWRPFVGLAHIQNFETFFAALTRDSVSINGEKQLSSGFAGLLKAGLASKAVTWRDTGTDEAYTYAQRHFGEYAFAKVGEAIYFENKKVIKFFADSEIARKRVLRARKNPEYLPEIAGAAGGFYCYEFVPGDTLAQVTDLEIWEQFFGFVEERYWTQVALTNDFGKLCHSFYVDKTLGRIHEFLKRHNLNREGIVVNGIAAAGSCSHVEAMAEELARQGGVPGRIHGDLQPENVLVTSDGFKLIDWRQDFGGSLDVGDRYWDLAKFSLWFDFQFGRLRPDSINARQEGARIYADWRSDSHPAAARFSEFLKVKNYDVRRIERLKILALFNMAGVHPAPLCHLFFGEALKRLFILKSRQSGEPDAA